MPTGIRSIAPPNKGTATNNPFCVALSAKSSAMDTPKAATSSQAMKLTSKCSHAPKSEGQCPLRMALTIFCTRPSAPSDKAVALAPRTAHYMIAHSHFATDIPRLCSCSHCVYNHPPERSRTGHIR